MIRRKLFTFFIAVLAVCYIADFAGCKLIDDEWGAYIGTNVYYEGKVTGVSSISDKGTRFIVDVEQAGGKKRRFNQKIMVDLYSDSKRQRDKAGEECFRSKIGFYASVSYAAPQRNPHCFDYRRYLLSEGIGAVANIDGYEIINAESNPADRYRKLIFKKKNEYSAALREDVRGLVMGTLFGDTAYLEENAYEAFSQNGTAHVLAVSGLHIGILYGIHRRIFGKKHCIASVCILIIIICTYGELSCWSLSAVRAAAMIFISVAAELMDLRYDSVTAMSSVGLAIIIHNPYAVFGTGFQMSFLAVCSIAFIKPHIPRIVPDYAAVVLSVNLGLLPYQLYCFNYFSPASLMANIPVVYLAGILVPLAILHFVMFSYVRIPVFIKFLEWASGGMALLMQKINNLFCADGMFCFDIPCRALWAVILSGCLLFFISSETYIILRLKKKYSAIGMVAVLIFIFSFCAQNAYYSPLSDDNIVFVDVGQGDCVHIRSENKNILIDGGGKHNYNVGKKVLKPYLLKNGVSCIDLAIATHEHTDHYKGLEELRQVYDVKKTAKRIKAETTVAVSENVRITTLWPEHIDEEKGQDENSCCSVFMVHYKSGRRTYKILITGDLDEKGEREIISRYGKGENLRADILKIGHHGSSTSTSDEFLEAVSPDYAVIQCGKNNYGHPSPKVIEKCTKKGIMILRNDYNGAVGFRLGENGVDVHKMID